MGDVGQRVSDNFQNVAHKAAAGNVAGYSLTQKETVEETSLYMLMQPLRNRANASQ